MNIYAGRNVVFHIADGDVILLSLDIEQAVYEDCKVVSSDVCVMDGYRYVLLLLCRITQQLFHSFSQSSVVVNTDGRHGHKDAYNQCPIQEHTEEWDGDGIMENKREQEEIADGDKEYQPEHSASLMPNAPGFDMSVQWNSNCQPINAIAAKRD